MQAVFKDTRASTLDKASYHSFGLEADLLRKDFIHFCVSLENSTGGVRVTAVCRPSAFRKVASIVASDSNQNDYPLFYRLIGEGAEFCLYEAFIPTALLKRKIIFNSIERTTQKRTRIWTAGSALELPHFWHFKKYSLVLEYNKNFVETSFDNVWRHYLRAISVDNGMLTIEMNHFGMPAPISGEVVIYKFRDEARSFSAPIEIIPLSRAFRIPSHLHAKYNNYEVFGSTVSLDIAKCFPSSGLYSIMIRVDQGLLRGLFPYNKNYNLKKDLFTGEIAEKYFAFHHFSDRSTKNIRFEFFSFNSDQKHMVDEILDSDKIESAPDKSLILCGEYTTTARDNGWAIFNYLDIERPELPSAYVIDRHNHDGVVPDNKRVLEYGSIEHLSACRTAKAVLFTHHSVYVFPHVMRRAIRSHANRPVDYFLQHGVLAIKPVLDDYAKRLHGYDLFNVSSERERLLVMQQCGFEREDVTIAGLPRWDRLYKAQRDAVSVEGGRPTRILVFPTWRKGLDKLSSDDFTRSEFWTLWGAALHDMAQRADESGTEIVFCVHSIFERFLKFFRQTGATVLPLRSVIDELADFDLLITDYSSLCFDFLFMNKPTMFFMFDKEAFFEKKAAYVDPETLPGLTFEQSEPMADAIFSDWATTSLILERQIDSVRSLYADHYDDSNCARVIEALEHRLNQVATLASLEITSPEAGSEASLTE